MGSSFPTLWPRVWRFWHLPVCRITVSYGFPTWTYLVNSKKLDIVRVWTTMMNWRPLQVLLSCYHYVLHAPAPPPPPPPPPPPHFWFIIVMKELPSYCDFIFIWWGQIILFNLFPVSCSHPQNCYPSPTPLSTTTWFPSLLALIKSEKVIWKLSSGKASSMYFGDSKVAEKFVKFRENDACCQNCLYLTYLFQAIYISLPER